MPKIGVVDDREEHRTTVEKNIRLFLDEKEWECVGIPPYHNLEEYIELINDDVVVLVVDERLQEVPVDGEAVNYNGNVLATFLRERIPDYPIYVVTAHAEDSDLLNSQANVEGVIARKDFIENAAIHVPRIARAGQRFYSQYHEVFGKLSDLAMKIATGVGTENDEKELAAIQLQLAVQLPANSQLATSQVVNDIEQHIKQFDELSKSIEEILGKQ